MKKPILRTVGYVLKGVFGGGCFAIAMYALAKLIVAWRMLLSTHTNLSHDAKVLLTIIVITGALGGIVGWVASLEKRDR